MKSQKQLAVNLSKLKGFDDPKFWQEQYMTESEDAAKALWFGLLNDDIEGKTVADLGAGTGILGFGAALLGAKFVYLVEREDNCLEALNENRAKAHVEDETKIVFDDLSVFTKKVDTIIMNPPFGTKQKHADKAFLEHAVKLAPVIYSFHKSNTRDFIFAFCEDHGYAVTHEIPFSFRLRKTMKQHSRNRVEIEVSLFRMQRL